MFGVSEIEQDPFGCIRCLSELIGALVVENRRMSERLAILEAADRRVPLDDERVVPTAPRLN